MKLVIIPESKLKLKNPGIRTKPIITQSNLGSKRPGYIEGLDNSSEDEIWIYFKIFHK